MTRSGGWPTPKAGSPTTRYDYDGQDLITELDANGNVLRRYVHGPDTDEPLVWYEGAGAGDRRWLHADERGSVVAVTGGTGARIALNTYDAFGQPGTGNSGRFQYTGQTWLPEVGLYYYKARMYDPKIGRFIQTDPIGVAGGVNLYAYAGNDPVNYTDPSGLQTDGEDDEEDIVVTANLHHNSNALTQSNGGGGSGDIVVTAPRTSFSLCDLNPFEAICSGNSLGVTPTTGIFDQGLGAAIAGATTTQNDDIIVTARRKLAKALGDFADNYLKPPAGRQDGESFSDCVQRIAGDGSLAVGGATAVASGANIVPYPRAVPPGGSGTSIISTISRGLLRGFPRMGSRIAGTTSVGGAVGRVASRGSVYAGAAAIGLAAGKAGGCSAGVLAMMSAEIEEHILTQARAFSANQHAKLDNYVYKDLGIGGGDAVEFYGNIEKRFGIDIRPITESSAEVEASWFRKARRESVARDVQLAEIVSFIMSANQASL